MLIVLLNWLVSKIQGVHVTNPLAPENLGYKFTFTPGLYLDTMDLNSSPNALPQALFLLSHFGDISFLGSLICYIARLVLNP